MCVLFCIKQNESRQAWCQCSSSCICSLRHPIMETSHNSDMPFLYFLTCMSFMNQLCSSKHITQAKIYSCIRKMRAIRVFFSLKWSKIISSLKFRIFWREMQFKRLLYYCISIIKTWTYSRYFHQFIIDACYFGSSHQQYRDVVWTTSSSTKDLNEIHNL